MLKLCNASWGDFKQDQPFVSFPMRGNALQQNKGIDCFLFLCNVTEAKIFYYVFLEGHNI